MKIKKTRKWVVGQVTNDGCYTEIIIVDERSGDIRFYVVDRYEQGKVFEIKNRD